MTSSCEWISSIIHDDEVVAKLGNVKLYRSELESYIPGGISQEDSTVLTFQYINTWAMELLYMDVAEEQLSKEEMDMTEELEEYRRSLIKYRYAQRYVNERLDTLVTRDEVEKYYQDFQEQFVVKVPLVKYRYLNIMQESPNLQLIKDRMSSSNYDELVEADSLAYSSAIKYEDHSETWADMNTLARNFGKDYTVLLSELGTDGYIEIPDERGDIKIAYIVDMIREGQMSPLDYSERGIKEIIISARKRTLLSDLEKDLLNDALEHNNLIIY